MKNIYDKYDNIEVPFDECINCKMFNPWFSSETHYKSVSCTNEPICINAILIASKSLTKEVIDENQA